jgi:glycine cleavage system H protein
MSATETKADRKYTKEHEWAKEDGGEVLVGITAFAVDQLGDITLVGLDVNVGDQVTKGKAFGTIESVKTLSDLYAPISGKVTRINGNLEGQPELINEDPWEKGWMLAIAPSNLAAEQGSLLDDSTYKQHLEHSDH